VDVSGLTDVLSLADKYGIGWVFALGEALLLVWALMAFASGKITTGKHVEKVEKQRDMLLEKVIGVVDTVERNNRVLENMKPQLDKDGGG